MDGKRVADFLLLRPAFSSRNLTSLALVALFFGVYVAAGGKVSSIPKLQTGSSFGGVSIPDGMPTSNTSPTTELIPSADEPAALVNKMATKKSTKSLTADLFDDSAANTSAKKKAPAVEVAPAEPVEETDPVADDDLAAIEKRVKRLKPKEGE